MLLELISPVIYIIFELNSTGAGHASEFSDLKIEETGYICLLQFITG